VTIGTAASGPIGGQAIFDVLRAVERVATGAAGGFAAFVAITEEGDLLRAETQRGGTRTLFIKGEITGAALPPRIAAARLAGLMSSGPDRPLPLAQFVPADLDAGLVTGHRLPNLVGRRGVPLNLEVLELMRRGLSAKEAVDAVLEANPDADAGMIAVDRSRRVCARNSARVEGRPDIGCALRENPGFGATVAVLHNAIVPCGAIAWLAADTALETMVPSLREDSWILVNAGTPVTAGEIGTVLVDERMEAVQVITAERRLLDGLQNGAAIYLHSLVRQGDRLVGRTITEPHVVVDGGRIVSMSGQTSLRLAIQRIPA
jgi:hypothetical protein